MAMSLQLPVALVSVMINRGRRRERWDGKRIVVRVWGGYGDNKSER